MSQETTAPTESRPHVAPHLSRDYLAEKYGALFLANGLLTSDKFNYVYVINYRCGSSTIRDILVQLEQSGTVEAQSNVGNPRQAARRVLRKFFDGDEATVEARLNNPNLTWFSMVRHPVTRLASAYASKIVPRLAQEARVRTWLEENGVTVGNKITFGQFLTYLENVGLHRVDRHWRLQRDVLMYGDVRYDCLGRMETFEADMIAILKRIGADAAKLPVVNARSTTDKFVNELSQADLDRIGKIYEADFDTFGYGRAPAP